MRRQRKTSPLRWPTWLVELATHDVPPTALEGKLLARLAGTGVTYLVPSDGTTFLDVSDADRATAIGAAGPGFGVAEPLGAESAPVAEALARLDGWLRRFDRLRRLRLAAIDMELAVSTARALARRDVSARVFERVLETGLVVTYARPYLESNRAGVGKKWVPKDAPDRALHDRIIKEMRHPYHAHADRTSRRTLIDTTAFLGLDGPPIFAEAWDRLDEDELEQLAALADKQAQRLAEEADKLGAQLGEKRDMPSHPRDRPKATLWLDSRTG